MAWLAHDIGWRLRLKSSFQSAKSNGLVKESHRHRHRSFHKILAGKPARGILTLLIVQIDTAWLDWCRSSNSYVWSFPFLKVLVGSAASSLLKLFITTYSDRCSMAYLTQDIEWRLRLKFSFQRAKSNVLVKSWWDPLHQAYSHFLLLLVHIDAAWHGWHTSSNSVNGWNISFQPQQVMI